METALRSVVKTVIYRIFIILLTCIIFVMSGLDPFTAFRDSIALNILYMVCYYINERIWNKIQWGKV
jgi:uncharacterized membrane protein